MRGGGEGAEDVGEEWEKSTKNGKRKFRNLLGTEFSFFETHFKEAD